MVLGGPLGISFAKNIKSSRTLNRWLKPVATWYAQASGYRQNGLKYDDLVNEENTPVEKALSRLSERESYDRVFRIRTAIQQSILHAPLPREKWVKPEDDVRYLKPILEEVLNEEKERKEWDNIKLVKKS